MVDIFNLSQHIFNNPPKIGITWNPQPLQASVGGGSSLKAHPRWSKEKSLGHQAIHNCFATPQCSPTHSVPNHANLAPGAARFGLVWWTASQQRKPTPCAWPWAAQEGHLKNRKNLLIYPSNFHGLQSGSGFDHLDLWSRNPPSLWKQPTKQDHFLETLELSSGDRISWDKCLLLLLAQPFRTMK